MGAKITSSAALAGKTLYIGDYAGRLIAISTMSGKVKFTSRVNGRIYGTPAVAGGRVFILSSTGGSLTAFTTGRRYLWRVSTGSYVYSSPAVWAGRVFFGSYNGRFYSVAAKLRTRPLVCRRRRPGVRCRGRRRRRRLCRQHVRPDHGPPGEDGSSCPPLPARRVRAGLGNGKRLLLHGYLRTWAVEER